MTVILIAETLVPTSLLAMYIVLIAVQFLPNRNTEKEESDANLLL
jgi:hypothetical protein